MKVNPKHLIFLPKARYVITNRGVKAFGFDNVSGARLSVNISKQQRQQVLLDLIMAKGLGKQYV